MTCRAVRKRLSAYLDGDLRSVEARGVARHLEVCERCAREFEGLHAATAAVADLPRLEPSETIASRVFDRLEVETRGPGLALLFRSALAARPLMLPSLVPAVLLLAALASALAWLGSEPELPAVARSTRGAWGVDLPRAGTEANPLFPSAGVSAPRRAGPGLSDELLASLSEGNDFFETVVARDGSVSDVILLDGNIDTAGPLLDALRRERFAPARYRGRPVAVSVYRLFSRMEVRASAT
jgi:hypothetical protein